MSHHESWPGEPSDVAGLEDELDEPGDDEDDDEDTGDEPAPLDDEPDDDEASDDGEPSLRLAGHAGGELDVPDDVDLLEGEPRSTRRGVGVVVSRTNVEITNRLLESALLELEQVGVARDQVMVMAVPGAFETGVPVAFGVLTVDTFEQANARVASGAAAVRTALEMADLFHQLRSTAQAAN